MIASDTILKTLFAVTFFVACTSCTTHHDDHPSQAKTPITPPETLYPPVSSRWDFAIELSGDESEAAKLAAEADVLYDDFTMSNNFNPDAMGSFNRIVAADRGLSKGFWDGSKTERPGTGGSLYRVVQVNPGTEGGWDITICNYDSPGIYDVVDNKPVHDPQSSRVGISSVSNVRQTTEPSAENKKAPAQNPRLLVHSIFPPPKGTDAPGGLCDKFMPDPFIQTPPPPLPPATGHK